jgi:galactose-1-phosphate uridylyltransferase
MFCQSREEEIADRQRLLLLTEHFVALELYASPAPFCTPMYPRRHMASVGDSSAAEIADLARVLRTVLAKL